MNTESQTPQLSNEDLFSKFYNEDLTPEQITSQQAPSATEVAPETGEPKVGSESATSNSTTEVAATDQQPPSGTEASDTNDWLAQLPPEVRAQFEQAAAQANYWQQKHQEQVSKNRKLHNEVNNLKAKVTQNPATDTRTPEEVDEDWKKLEEADPVLAKILRKREEQIEARLRKEADDKARQYVEPIAQERQEQYIAYQQDVLTQTVPNWREVVQDPYFKGWMENASPGVKALYNSYEARDSIYVLQLYANEMQARFGQSAPAQNVQADPQVAPEPAKPSVQAQRQERLAKSAPIPATPAGQTKPAQLTPDELFKKFYDNPDVILDLLNKK